MFKILFSSLLLVFTCEALQVTYPSNPNYHDYAPDQNSVFHRYSQNDAKIDAKIRQKLKIWFDRGYEGIIKIDVVDGEVSLYGQVESIWDKDDIERRVRSVDGVRAINNQISVHSTVW